MTQTPALARANGHCELCSVEAELSDYPLPNSEGIAAEEASVALCATCLEQLDAEPLDDKYWLCLQASAWSPYAAVQVLAHRTLGRLADQTWAVDLQESMFMEEDVRQWAEQGQASAGSAEGGATVDCHGSPLAAGDTVTIIKDLDVKGANMVAKRGTAVRNISLSDNPEHIEGRVNGQRIVLLTKFVKKSS
ncbi:PhnA domain-containing protein [Halioxenophilus sp. WMMB6]|uniref:PhnA domain-containing protein n=1 Tax=Halioxenophilus sp. WMMB6 TaxID=3073815 RepID=UPI00295E559A|nr:PhnA domain-containing protein [Halioxenophilus sp. WMMB6]